MIKSNFMQWAFGLIIAPILHLYTSKADKEDLRLKADQATVDEMSKTLHSMDEKLDMIVFKMTKRGRD
jgi:hypothetical protein